MQTRSYRGIENPYGASHSKVRVNDWNPIRAKRPAAILPHKRAGHMTAADQCCSHGKKFLRRRRPHMTQADIGDLLLDP
jgi:hypothetical protein